ncbi:hypothetical protein SNEBB_007207 [Seison nebaliae]|nr:hypothetical protein SNEBB_007207 [Seison nebaliae]
MKLIILLSCISFTFALTTLDGTDDQKIKFTPKNSVYEIKDFSSNPTQIAVFGCIIDSGDPKYLPQPRWEIVYENDKENVKNVTLKEEEGQFEYRLNVILSENEKKIGQYRCIFDLYKRSHTFFIIDQGQEKPATYYPSLKPEEFTTIKTAKPIGVTQPTSPVTDRPTISWTSDPNGTIMIIPNCFLVFIMIISFLGYTN